MSYSVERTLAYAREGLSVGIVHIGVGGFHRSHLASYMDRLLRGGTAEDWTICGVGLMPEDRRLHDSLARQDLTYTLVECSPGGDVSVRRVGSICELLLAPDETEMILERIASPQTRIVSLTITEGGYNVDDVTGWFVRENPCIIAELGSDKLPRTVFGVVTEGLRRRRARGNGPLTVMSCDNLPQNGIVAREAFTSYAELIDSDLARWIHEEVAFPSSMVDRITPATTEREVRFVNDVLGIADECPVICEDYTQWVLEDLFPAGRPAFEHVGVQLVRDVYPYEKMKLRLLNASHQALAYLGHLRGHTFAHEAVRDPEVRDFVKGFMHREVRPTLDPLPGIDLDRYCETLLERFGNEAIADTLSRLGTDGTDRIAKFILPIAHDRMRAGAGDGIALCARIVAAWALCTERARLGLSEQLAIDRKSEHIRGLFDAADGDPSMMVRSDEIFGDLAHSKMFIAAVSAAYVHLIAEWGIELAHV